MILQQPFDATKVEPSSFAPPPVLSDYHVRIVESEAKPNSNGTGGYLQLDIEILDQGPYAGTKVPYRLNLYHTSQQTVEIAYRQLSAICHVTKVFNITDTRQLHGIPFMAKIGPQKDDPRYANVFAVMDINGVAPGKQGAPAAASQPAAAPANVAAPAWAPPGAAQAPPTVVPPATAVPTWGASQPAAAPPSVAPAQVGWGAPANAAPPAWAPSGGAPAAPPWAQK